MKIYLNKPKDNWVSPYWFLDKIFFWKEIDYDDPLIEKLAKFLTPFCLALQKMLNVINPQIQYVKIDYWDTWSADYTISRLVVPLLQQLKKDKHGAPSIDDEDVPEEIRSTSAPSKENDYDIDGNWFKRWEYVLDEMIWAHEQIIKPDGDTEFYDHSEVDYSKGIRYQVSKIKVDSEGLDKYNKRIENGLRLFGKYYRGLWD